MSSELLDWVRYGSPCLYSQEDQEFKARLDYIHSKIPFQTNKQRLVAATGQASSPGFHLAICPH